MTAALDDRRCSSNVDVRTRADGHHAGLPREPDGVLDAGTTRIIDVVSRESEDIESGASNRGYVRWRSGWSRNIYAGNVFRVRVGDLQLTDHEIGPAQRRRAGFKKEVRLGLIDDEITHCHHGNVASHCRCSIGGRG
jgi:hypothetical protein